MSSTVRAKESGASSLRFVRASKKRVDAIDRESSRGHACSPTSREATKDAIRAGETAADIISISSHKRSIPKAARSSGKIFTPRLLEAANTTGVIARIAIS
jgi:hypothetical protein